MTADSPSYPERHRAIARRVAEQFGFNHLVIQTSEMARPEYRANPANRCYFCEYELYTHLSAIAPVSAEFRQLPTAATPTIGAITVLGGRRHARISAYASAGRGGADQGGHPRAVAPGRSADVE